MCVILVCSLAMKKIEAIQNPRSCRDASYLLCKHDNRCGLGCTMHKLAWCFTVALQQGRTLIAGDGYFTAHRFDVRSHNACVPNSGDMTCWFESLSRCTEWVYQNQKEPCTTASVDIMTISWHRNNEMVHANLSAVADTPLFNDVDLSLGRFTDVPRRLFWLQSMLIGYLFRPNEAVRDFIEERRRNFHISSPLGLSDNNHTVQQERDREINGDNNVVGPFGVHIRRTDKQEEVEHRSVSEYPEALRALARKLSDRSALPTGVLELQTNLSSDVPQVCSVFLATDDKTIIQQFINLLHVSETFDPNNTQASASLRKQERGSRICKRWKVIQTDSVSFTRGSGSWEYTASVIFDIDTLANSVGFVGTQSSNLGRMVFELMTFRAAHWRDSIEHRVFSLGTPFTIMHHEPLLKSFVPYEHTFRR